MSHPFFSCPALPVDQPIGRFWLASIPANVLLKVTMPDPLRIVVDPDVRVSDDEFRKAMKLLGNQRPLEQDRLKAIASYIDTYEATFPNSIILSANGESSDDAPETKPWKIETDGGTTSLVIPENARPASVVDGQHRLYAFLKSSVEGRQRFCLACAIFFDMPQSIQAMVFATINANQKQVRRSLALNMYGYNVEDEPRDQWSPEKLSVFMTRRLNFDENSPLHRHIKIEAVNAPLPVLLPGASRMVPMAAVVDGILRLVTSNYKRDRDYLRSERFLSRRHRLDLPADGAPLRELYRLSMDRELYAVIRSYLELVYECLWAPAPEGSMLTRAVGIRALLTFLGDIGLSASMKPARKDAESVLAAQVRSAFTKVLTLARDVDFADPFFEATGRGQSRIRTALRLVAGIEKLVDVNPSDRPDYERLMPGKVGRRNAIPVQG